MDFPYKIPAAAVLGPALLAFAHGRAVDINDLIANTLGGLLGYATLRAAQRAATTRAALERVSSPAHTAG
ncbi:VanZ family protein [Streptomyces sp. B27]|uniref:VanZ family protein n=1 Tax=Streptomyces TaxID=1883 RepID=UPI001F0BDDF9|nr:VanZ family protein [Streptomyces sp. B27]